MKRTQIGCGLLVVIAIGLWLWSGREIWTKSGLPVAEEHRDAFGDVQILTVMRPGPLGGYYLGLDIVVAVVTASLALIGIVWMVRRMRSRSSQGVEGHAS